jgi:hypothetical protein
MAHILDCLVSYFGLDEQEEPNLRRYFSYHILAGPGPTKGTGVAFIKTLAVSHESERCTYCQTVHMSASGPASAIARAVRYLDAVHQGRHLRKVQSPVRGLREKRRRMAPEPALVVLSGTPHAPDSTAIVSERIPAPWRTP